MINLCVHFEKFFFNIPNFRRIFANAHTYHINSISVNSDQVYPAGLCVPSSSSFFLSRTYSLILSTQQEVYKRKLVKLTQLDCERNQRQDFGNGKETRCSTCTYFKSCTSHCTLSWAILTHSSCESSKKCHHQIHFSQPCSLSDKLLFSPAFP